MNNKIFIYQKHILCCLECFFFYPSIIELSYFKGGVYPFFIFHSWISLIYISFLKRYFLKLLMAIVMMLWCVCIDNIQIRENLTSKQKQAYIPFESIYFFARKSLPKVEHFSAKTWAKCFNPSCKHTHRFAISYIRNQRFCEL